MARNEKYPETGRDTPVIEIMIVLGLSALVVFLATQWRAQETENWEGWMALALFPGVLLRWLEIVRRTEWALLEVLAAALMTAIAAWGYMRIGSPVLAAAAATFACFTLWLARRPLFLRD